jgi:hypothetical protein
MRDREIVRLYQGGQSLNQIAHAHDLTFEGVRQILIREGVTRRTCEEGLHLRYANANE